MSSHLWDEALLRLARAADAAGENPLRAVVEATRLRAPDYLYDCLAMGISLDAAVRWCEKGVPLEVVEQVVKVGLAECSSMTRDALDQPQLTYEEVKDAILCKDETGRYVWRVVDNPGN